VQYQGLSYINTPKPTETLIEVRGAARPPTPRGIYVYVLTHRSGF